ncbi:MAG: hypothetical protein P8O07_00285 [Crocinitomicaceae bacterium]|nr:hypothetical protein [Crocinitomicaceae bacterium]
MKSAKFFVLLSITYLMLCGAGKKPIPKRLIGTYVGEQDSYEMIINNTPFTIPSVDLTVRLSYNELLLSSPNKVTKGRYQVTAPTKKYYSLKVYFEDGTIENWQLFRRGKKIHRDGLNPRPSVVFVKR